MKTLQHYIWVLLYGACLLLPSVLQAEPFGEQAAERVYSNAIAMAAQGKNEQALTALQAASQVLNNDNIWKQRMQAASWLLAMRQQLQSTLPMQATAHLPNLALAQTLMDAQSAPPHIPVWPVAVLATLLPGAGHAWLGRWHDALIAAVLVWPMLLLTLWSIRRAMGPVTVFFAMISVWLWSGTVFSAVSLAKRGFSEAYLLWWQGVWQASALPGVPW